MRSSTLQRRNLGFWRSSMTMTSSRRPVRRAPATVTHTNATGAAGAGAGARATMRPAASLLLLLLGTAVEAYTPRLSQQQSTCETFPGCRGGALCRPLSPQPTFDHEVVAYHADGAYGANGSEYAAYGASSSPSPPHAPTPLTPPHPTPHLWSLAQTGQRSPPSPTTPGATPTRPSARRTSTACACWPSTSSP